MPIGPRYYDYLALVTDPSGATNTNNAFANVNTAAQGPFGAYNQRIDFLNEAVVAEVMAALDNLNGYNALTYAASMTPNAKFVVNTIIPTNTDVFTVANPSNDTYAQSLTLRFLNSSGGTMGNVTFGSLYKLATTFAKPANGTARYYVFSKTAAGTWEEVGRTATDITP